MLLDTSAYSALLRDWPGAVRLVAEAREIAMPLPVIGELRHGFRLGNQEVRNEKKLQRFLATDHVRIIEPDLETSGHYANVAAYCQQLGRALGQNDLWIAAISRQHGLPLATYDRDFTSLSGLLGDNLILLN